MSEIDILVKASQEGLDNITTAADKINDLGDAATEAGGDGSHGLGLLGTIASAGVITGFVSGLASKLPEIVSDLYKAGDSATKAATGFAAMGGKENDLEKLRSATEGLVSDTDLMRASTTVMKNNFSASVGSVDDILDKGGKLGEIFEGGATEGVKAFSKAISDVGSYTTLDDLGLDVDGVKEKFTKLKEMMSDRDAWGMAIMQEADEAIKKLPTSLDSTHPAIERFKTKIENFRDTAGKALTDWLDDSLNKLDRLFGGTGGSQGVQHPENSGLGQLGKGEGPAGPALPPGYGTGHSSQYGDVSGEGEGYGMYDQGGSGSPTPKRDAATIEKPKITAAEFDAIVRSANAASAATVGFGAAGALAMGGLALSSAVAASQIGNITTQGNGALSILKQLEVQLQTLASLTIVVNATTQGGGGTGSSRSGSGRGGGVQGPPR